MRAIVTAFRTRDTGNVELEKNARAYYAPVYGHERCALTSNSNIALSTITYPHSAQSQHSLGLFNIKFLVFALKTISWPAKESRLSSI